MPVAVLPWPVTVRDVENAYLGQDEKTVALAIPQCPPMSYAGVKELAQTLVAGSGDRELFVCLGQDVAKALGQCIRLLRSGQPCLCIDGVALQNESFLDIGAPVGPAFPVVIKTLVLQAEGNNGTG